MPLTKITGQVIKDNTLIPDDFSQGKPLWNTTGYLTATKFFGDGSLLTGVTAAADVTFTAIQVLTSTTFEGYLSADAFVGDGSLLTNIQKTLKVYEVTDNIFTITPEHDKSIIFLNSLSTIEINTKPDETFSPGHLTIFVQFNEGRGIFVSPYIFNADSFYETKNQYAVCQLLNYSDFGYNWTLYGDLTSTSLSGQVTPTTPISSNVSFTQIFAGENAFSFALSGTDLYATGYNNAGQLGLNYAAGSGNTSLFTKVIYPTNAKWTKVNAGDRHALALSGTDLYVTGYNYYGQLGLNSGGNNTNNRSTFTKVTIPTNAKWTDVLGGGGNSYALSGTDLYACGWNFLGELGLRDLDSRSTFTKVSSAVIWDGNFPIQDFPNYTVFNNAKWTSIEAGYFHILALSGTDLYVCGNNSSRQLGLGAGPKPGGFLPQAVSMFVKVLSAWNGSNTVINPQWTAIAASSNHSLALSGTDLYGAGSNNNGQLGLNSNTGERETFTKVTIPANAKWTAIGAGSEYSYALSGTDLYVCGLNTDGQLGLGDTAPRSTFTKVNIPANAKWTITSTGNRHSLALSGTNLFIVGYGFANGIGNNTPRLTFTQITGVAIPV